MLIVTYRSEEPVRPRFGELQSEVDPQHGGESGDARARPPPTSPVPHDSRPHPPPPHPPRPPRPPHPRPGNRPPPHLRRVDVPAAGVALRVPYREQHAERQ